MTFKGGGGQKGVEKSGSVTDTIMYPPRQETNGSLQILTPVERELVG